MRSQSHNLGINPKQKKIKTMFHWTRLQQQNKTYKILIFYNKYMTFLDNIMTQS